MFAGWCCFLLSFRRIGRLLGATLHAFPVGEDEPAADAALERRARVLADEGRRPYVIHSAPGHPPLGGLGYVLAAEEVTAQARALGVGFDAVVCASGSALTHAGVLVGLRALGEAAPGDRATGSRRWRPSWLA